jgi:riboflavin kinase/FMN adenylyltransferase
VYIVEAMKRLDRFYGNVGLTIGNFEGFHRGHREIIGTLAAESRDRGLQVAVITFKEHPLKMLRGNEPERLTLPNEKILRLRKEKVDLLLYLDFSPSFADTKPLDFLEQMQRYLAPRFLCLGRKFRFGKDNRGDIDFLVKMGGRFDFDVRVVDDVLHENEPISSTRIRDAVKRGRFRLANAMLGRDYHLYVSAVPERSLVLPLCGNCAFPRTGSFRGELRCVHTGVRREVHAERFEGGFVLGDAVPLEEDCLYTLSFMEPEPV